jgi:hypothetical protein
MYGNTEGSCVSVNVFQMSNNTVGCCHTNKYSKSEVKKDKREKEREKSKLSVYVICFSVSR